MPQHRSEVVTFSTGLNVFSVLIAVVVALGMAKVITADAIAWLICPLSAGLVYLVLESRETALGERPLMKHGDRDGDDVSG